MDFCLAIQTFGRVIHYAKSSTDTINLFSSLAWHIFALSYAWYYYHLAYTRQRISLNDFINGEICAMLSVHICRLISDSFFEYQWISRVFSPPIFQILAYEIPFIKCHSPANVCVNWCNCCGSNSEYIH